MGWFDEQIKQRKLNDDKEFESVFWEIADAVTGENISKLLADQHAKTLGAIQEIIRYYGCTMVESPGNFDSINDELEYLCRPNGIMRRTVQLEPKWYRSAFGAYLATDLENETVVALIPSKTTGKYYFFDESKGKKVAVTRKNADRFDSEAICFYKPLPLRPLTAKDIFKFGVSTWSRRDMILPFVLVLLATLAGLLIPELNNYLFEEVFESQQISFLVSTALFLGSVTVFRILISTMHTLITAKNSTKTSVSVEAAIMMRILSLPADFFKQYSSGEIMQRVNYANALCDTFVDLLFNTGVTSLFSILYISQITRFARPLLWPSLLILFASLIFALLLAVVKMRHTKLEMEAESAETGTSYALITGVQKIKLAGAEKRAFVRWGHRYSKLSKARYREPLVVRAEPAIANGITLFGVILLYFIAVRSHISVANFYAFESAYGMVTQAFMALVGIAESVAEIRPALQLIKPIMEAEPEVSEGKQLISGLSGGIELNNVSFRYTENMPPVINNLTLKIRPGQYVAVVGKTGCGKSTLMRLLLGFEKPQRGAIYYDGKDLNSIDLKSLRRHIGTVMQNGSLFQGDVFSNITVSAPWLTMDEAWEAAEQAGIADEIRRMPMGMHTLISEGTGGISGGQRQRLMIARAIAPKPKILMFDEATSALDNITQKIVSDSLDALHCTRIVIAHRLSTIRHCDRILYLEEGHIEEDGSFEDLMAKNGKFAELVNRQLLEEEQK